ncbi:MAG: stage II sporulation protein M [Planctomycetes bacterium]|nr:stage II sporulation protein M [Planctomycetota bacterium]
MEILQGSEGGAVKGTAAGGTAAGGNAAGGEATASDAALERLHDLLHPRRALKDWHEAELLELPRLYRHACTRLARAEQDGADPRRAHELRGLTASAHGLLLREAAHDARPWLVRALEFVLRASPRAIRAEWRLLAASFALFYGLAAVAWVAVRRDVDLAHSFMGPALVDQELEQLAALEPGESFRGNFTFGLAESPAYAGALPLHNIGVGIVFFASALLPPFYLFLLSQNALMLGTYTAVAGHWGQAGSISSIVWTHGVLEIEALILAGTAGLVLVRAWVRPGAFTRAHALVRESRRALELFVPVFPLLVVAGFIEGFVSPHAPLGVRLTIAVASGVALVSWVALGGRRAAEPAVSTKP